MKPPPAPTKPQQTLPLGQSAASSHAIFVAVHEFGGGLPPSVGGATVHVSFAPPSLMQHTCEPASHRSVPHVMCAGSQAAPPSIATHASDFVLESLVPTTSLEASLPCVASAPPSSFVESPPHAPSVSIDSAIARVS